MNKQFNFLKLVLNDSSMSEFVITEDELSAVYDVLKYKVAEVKPTNILQENRQSEYRPQTQSLGLGIQDIFRLLKNISVSTPDCPSSSDLIKLRILLKVIAGGIIEATDIGLADTITTFYDILNSYIIGIRRDEICQTIADISTSTIDQYRPITVDFVNFKVYFTWLTQQVMPDVFFFKEVKPLIPVLVACLKG